MEETKQKKRKKPVKKLTIRCRKCFMVDSYTPDEKKCRHCGAELYLIDVI